VESCNLRAGSARWRADARASGRPVTLAAHAAGACLLVTGLAAACPPPPGPPPTVEAQAAVQWDHAANLCELVLDDVRPLAERIRGAGRWAIAEAHWEASVRTMASIKGHCEAGLVVFPEVSPALCGLGMPAANAPLVAAIDADRTLTWWTAVDAPVASALRAIAASGGSR